MPRKTTTGARITQIRTWKDSDNLLRVSEENFGVNQPHEILFGDAQQLSESFYAPKDDDWRQDYTDQDLERFRQLLRVSEENFVRLVYAVRPGSSIAYSSDEDAASIIRKLETMAALGAN